MKKKPILENAPQNSNFIHPHPVLNRVFQNRGIQSAEDLNLSPSKLINPFTLKDMDKAVECIIDHYYNDSKVVIVGDFDCDGATSTTIAVDGLRLLGFKNVDFVVPDRAIHGYGLTENIAKEVCELKPDLIVTVDCGISSFDGAEYIEKYSKQTGHNIELVITDHHLQAKNGLIPPCAAAVNPNRNDCTSELKNLAGCGVMFYVIIALRSKMKELGIFKNNALLESKGVDQPSLTPLLDVVSLGTIADIVHLDTNNRIIVKMGLDLVKSGFARPAIHKILMDNKYTSPEKVNTGDWGFIVGPILNAAGRLENMSKGIEMLLHKDPHTVAPLVEELVQLNETRKEIGRDMAKDSEEMLSDFPFGSGIVLYNKDWHEGIVGILASRVKDKTNRPSICLTATHSAREIIENIETCKFKQVDKAVVDNLETKLDSELIKGSCRSIPGIHLKHVLDKLFSEDPTLLPKFGGHAMAAGVSLPHGRLKEFQEKFDSEMKAMLTEDMIAGNIRVDINNIPAQYLSLDTVDLIESFDPWGKGFEPPLFGGTFEICDYKLMGDDDQHVRLILKPEGSNKTITAVCWNCIENPLVLPFKVGNVVETVFKMQKNEFRGNVTLQLMLEHFYDEAREMELKMSKPQKNMELTGSYEF